MQRATWVLMLGAACAAAQTVEGTVTDSITGNGIPGVKVELVRMPDTVAADPQTERQNSLFAITEAPAVYSATTDSQGRFRLERVEPGTYTARYHAARHLDEAMAPKLDIPPLRRIHVPAAGTPVKLEERMIPLGELTGRVVDGRGQPVPNARVDFETGNLMGGQDTDKDGKFAEILFPGSTSILSVAAPLGWKPPDPDPDTGRPRAWVRTYYPGVADPAAAARIVGRPGVSQSDVELKLVALPTRALRGVVLNPDGTPAAKVPVVLGEDFFTPVQRTESKSDGAFEFPSAVDGLWRVSADLERGDVKFRAAEWPEIAGRDLEGVKLRLAAQVTVRGRIVIEAVQGRPSPRPPMVRLRAFGHGRMSEAAPPGRPDADGNFAMPYFYPGIYRFSPQDSAPPGYYLEAVRLGETTLAAPDVEITSGATPLTLQYNANGGTVRGGVENCASGAVLLVPQEPALRWPQSLLTGKCDSSNRYQIPSVRPGDYYALAFLPDPSSPLWLPEFDESLVGQAARITVRAGETTAADLHLIRRVQ